MTSTATIPTLSYVLVTLQGWDDSEKFINFDTLDDAADDIAMWENESNHRRTIIELVFTDGSVGDALSLAEAREVLAEVLSGEA